jgi:hypothetical protein
MSYRDVYIAERTMDQRVAERHNVADARHLARLARQGQPGGLAWHGRWMVCRLGFRLVALGAWLEGHSLPEAQPVRVKS